MGGRARPGRTAASQLGDRRRGRIYVACGSGGAGTAGRGGIAGRPGSRPGRAQGAGDGIQPARVPRTGGGAAGRGRGHGARAVGSAFGHATRNTSLSLNGEAARTAAWRARAGAPDACARARGFAHVGSVQAFGGVHRCTGGRIGARCMRRRRQCHPGRRRGPCAVVASWRRRCVDGGVWVSSGMQDGAARRFQRSG